MAERGNNISSQSTSNAPAVTGASAIDAKKPTIPAASETAAAPAPKGKKGTMLAINSGVIGVGLAFAPLVAGLLLTYTGLRTLFLVPAVMSAVLLVLGYFFLHNIYQRESRPSTDSAWA